MFNPELAGFVTALSLQSQVPGAERHQAAAGSPQGLSSALAPAEEKLQMCQVGQSSEGTCGCSCRASRDVGCWMLLFPTLCP